MTAAAYLIPVHDVHLRLAFRSGGCHRCYPAWTTWFADALAGCLRPSCVGGVALEPVTRSLDAPVGGAAPTSPQPVSSASLPVAAAAATAGRQAG